MPPKRFAFVVGMGAIGTARVATLTPTGNSVFIVRLVPSKNPLAVNDAPKRDPKPRRPVGRPAHLPAQGDRYSIKLPDAIARELREIGNGSISLGIVRLMATDDELALHHKP